MYLFLFDFEKFQIRYEFFLSWNEHSSFYT